MALAEDMVEFVGGVADVYEVDKYGTYDVDLDDLDGFHTKALTSPWSFERVREEPDKYVYLDPHLGYSDYSGGAVERSNVDVFLEEFSGRPGVYEVYGHHGSRQIAIRMNVSDPEIIETLSALQDYPILSEEHMSQLEMEAADEAAESYGYHDFARALEDKLGIEVADENSKAFKKLFWELISETPEGPRMEVGGGVVFPIDGMVSMVEASKPRRRRAARKKRARR